MPPKEVTVATGSSTGIGFETSLTLTTYASIHKTGVKTNQITDISKNENMPLQVIQLDVSDDKPALDAINRIAKENGRIDVILNNAEYALVGPLEQTSMEETKQFETKFLAQ